MEKLILRIYSVNEVGTNNMVSIPCDNMKDVSRVLITHKYKRGYKFIRCSVDVEMSLF